MAGNVPIVLPTLHRSSHREATKRDCAIITSETLAVKRRLTLEATNVVRVVTPLHTRLSEPEPSQNLDACSGQLSKKEKKKSRTPNRSVHPKHSLRSSNIFPRLGAGAIWQATIRFLPEKYHREMSEPHLVWKFLQAKSSLNSGAADFW